MNDPDYGYFDDLSDYANSSAVDFGTVSKLLDEESLDSLLAVDKQLEEEFDERVQWYHGKVARENAETLLREGFIRLSSEKANTDGLFLIREGSKNYSLSLIVQSEIKHYMLEEKKPCYFQIDNGEAVHGLDNFVEHHSRDAHGLPTKLTSFCKGSSPPLKARRRGFTNLLHRAVLEGIPTIVRDILNHPDHPNIDAKNFKGATALHDAAENGYHDIVQILLKHKCDVSIKDMNGHTPLQRAALKDYPNIIAVLVSEGRADPLAKSPVNEWTAMHEAAMAGNIKSLKMLLDIGHCPFPRNSDKETPHDIALKYHRNECVRCLENYKLPGSAEKPKLWYHAELDREGCTKVFECFGLMEGIFLIRKSTKGDGLYVLSLCHNMAVMNYVIKNKTYLKKTVYYIDHGPYLLSIPHLIYYYNRTADGLPCLLITAVTTSNNLDEVPREDDYYNLSSHIQDYVQPEKQRPKLPPRIEPSAPLPSSAVYTQPQKHDSAVNKNLNSSKIQNQSTPTLKSSIQPTSPSSPSDGPKLPETAIPTKPPEQPQHKIVKEKNLHLGNKIGEGEYGSVCKGTLTVPDKQSRLHRTKKIDVAVKTFLDDSVGDSSDFLREADVMQSLHHKCIVELIGVCYGKQLMLIEEFVSMGSMLDYLIEKSDEIDVGTDLYLWAGQIAEGMEYLESKKLVHRDLAARNILLATKHQIKISDFGLSRITGGESDYYRAHKGGRWPIKWYAPESVNYGKFTHASDVWSYGITLWEMFSFGESPYGEKKGIEVVEYIEAGKRLPKPEGCSKNVYDLMKNCWKKLPSERPKFHDIVSKFQDIPEYACIKDLLDSRGKFYQNTKPLCLVTSSHA